jgi:hypothetical protein
VPKPDPLSLDDVDALFAASSKPKPKRDTLGDADVDALFAGKTPKQFIVRDTCDNCHLATEPALAFGGDDPFEMPVAAGSPLALDLAVLRHRLKRSEVILCYPCVDALERPVGHSAPAKIVKHTKAPDVGDNERPRLFAVER